VKDKLESNNTHLETLLKLHLSVNDFKLDIDTFNHYLINNSLFEYRDNFLHQLARCEKIFLNGTNLGKYRTTFLNLHGIQLNEYVYAVYYIVVFYYTFDFDKHNSKTWLLSLEDNHITKLKKNLFEKVLNIISFNIEEGIEFSNKTISDFYNFDLFRNKPFVKVFNNLYLPIDGTFIENLTFNNLFYKIFDVLEENQKSDYMNCFGLDFENYASELTKLAVENNKLFDYIYIEEFEFQYKRNKLKSPDIMIFDKKENILLAIEVKSSRVLNSISNPINNDYSSHKSYEKTKLKPWKQVYESISKIVECKAHENINQDTIYMFLAISMNDIPLSAIQYEMKINDDSKSLAFYSMNIEAFEVFLKIISSDYDFSFSQILGGYNKYKETMSIKTYLSKIIGYNKIENKKFDDYFLNSQNNYLDFINNV
jgi:hypothetical protein